MVGGVLPLLISRCKIEKKVMNLISTFGAGLLLGVGLIIITPEGMSLVFQSYEEDSQAELLCGVGLISGFFLMLLLDELFTLYAHRRLHKLAHSSPIA